MSVRIEEEREKSQTRNPSKAVREGKAQEVPLSALDADLFEIRN